MKNYTNKGFTRLPNTFFNALLVVLPKLSSRELRITLLIIRLTYGCHEDWATLRKSDLKIVGIGISHANAVLESLLKKNLVLRDEGNRYQLNVDFILVSAFGQKERTERFKHVVGLQLADKFYQRGYKELTQRVNPLSPESEHDRYQDGNTTNGSFTPISSLIHTKTKQFKDTITDSNKYIDKEIIAFPYKKKGEERYPKVDPYSFKPQSEIEETALITWQTIERNNPDSFNFYLWAAHKGLPELCFLEFSEKVISQSKVKNPGRYFNGMVMNYLRQHGLILDNE